MALDLRETPGSPPAARPAEMPLAPPGPLAGILAAPLLLALAGLAVASTFQRPAPELGRPPERFSTARALHVLDWLTDAPRPTGSPAHARARLQLLAEIRALGLAPEIQGGEREGVALANVCVRLPGARAAAGAPVPKGLVLLVCHYDSRATTPGTCDDGAAVAALLQTLELLSRAPPLRNDLGFVFTDGEELGLLGAELFVAFHPWMAEASAVLNFDAIGNDGPLVLFQVGPGSRGLVDLYAEHAPHPVASSLAPSVYRHIGRDTDFTPFLARGLPGLNFALVGGGEAYHAPSDTPERIDRGSVELLGETVLALARATGDADLAALPHEDATFYDVLGMRVVRYGRTVSLVLEAAAGAWLLLALVRAARSHGLGTRHVVGGLLYQVLVLAGSAALSLLAFRALEALAPRLPLDPPPEAPSNLARASWTLAGLALVAAALAASAFELLRRRPSAPAAAAAGGLALWGALAAGLCLSDPFAGAQLVPAVALAALPLVLGPARGALVAWLASALALALAAPVFALTFHLLSGEIAVSAFVGAWGLGFLLFLAGPTLAAVRHGAFLRLALGLAGVVALGVGAWLGLPAH